MLDAKIASALNKIIQNSQFKKKVRLGEQRAQKEDRFLRGRQIAFIIYDYFRMTGAHDTVLDYADLFSVTLRDDNVQEFDTRWDEVWLSMSKDTIWWCLGKSVQIEDTRVWSAQNSIRIVWDGDSSKDIGAQSSKIEDDVEKKHGSETTIAKRWRQTRENRNRSSGQETWGIEWRWRRKRYLSPLQ